MIGPSICVFRTLDVNNKEASRNVKTVNNTGQTHTDLIDNPQLIRI